MARCWETRDCHEEDYDHAMGVGGDLRDTCAHPNELMDRCPTKCAFANCQRPTRVQEVDPELLFDPTVDRSVAIKEVCLLCGFFLTNGPRIGEGSPSEE